MSTEYKLIELRFTNYGGGAPAREEKIIPRGAHLYAGALLLSSKGYNSFSVINSSYCLSSNLSVDLILHNCSFGEVFIILDLVMKKIIVQSWKALKPPD